MPVGRTVQNIVGQKFGKLTVIYFYAYFIGRAGVKGGRKTHWMCKCECGNEVPVYRGHLTSGHTTSCGCSRTENPETFANDAYLNYKSGASQRGLQFELSLEECKQLFQSPCWYCDRLKTNVKRRKIGGAEYKYNGIDRVDNKLGYCVDNVVACCYDCNRAKCELHYSEFITLCRRVANKHSEEAMRCSA